MREWGESEDDRLVYPRCQYTPFEWVTPVKLIESRASKKNSNKLGLKKCFIFDKVEDKDWMMDDTAQGSDPHYLS